ncbi:hypothetical protein FQR65_LT10997 [Abscondita terminalis]|nr:hypothetical protein FQR65_LT10997 [Abscondita terminalis]
MEKVVIFGSTGNTGVCAVEAAVQKGLNVRAFVRDPSKLPDHLRDSVEVVKGDVLITPTFIMPLKMSPRLLWFWELAMKDLNVEIVSVCLSAFLFCEPEKVPQIFCKLNADHQRQFDAVKSSGLKYIAIFPPHIADKPSGTCEVEHDKLPPGTMIVSKYDLGKFLINCLTQPEHYGKTCGIITKY